MNVNCSILILIIVSIISAQNDTLYTLKTIHFSLGHTLNFRDPVNETNKVDWHIGAYFSTEFDSLLGLELDLRGTYERDNGINYYSHSEKLGFNYGYVRYIQDTEDSIQLFSISAFYPFLKFFKAGCDLSWDYWEKEYGLYLGFKTSFANVEIVFWDELRRIKGEISHKISIGKQKIFDIGLKASALYVGRGRLDWNAGYVAEFHIDL